MAWFRRKLALQLACAGVALGAPLASADTITWDANAGGVGQTDGGGTWLGVDQWWNGSANVTWNNATPDDAVIGNGGAGGTINLGAVTAGSIVFNPFTGTYTLAGTSITLNNGLTLNSGAGLVSITAPLTIGGAQTWTNNTAGNTVINGAINFANQLTLGGGTFQFGNLTNTGTGGLKLASGKLIVASSSAANSIAGNTLGGSVLQLSGGILTTSAAGGGGDRTFHNNLLVDGAVQINDGNNSGHTYSFRGVTQTFNGAVLSSRDNNGVTFANNPATLAGNLTINTPGAGTAAIFNFSGGFTVDGAASANRTISLNNGSVAVNLSGPLAGTAAGQTITLAGSGTNNNIGNITNGANTPGIIVNGTGTFTFTGTKTYSGPIALEAGVLAVNGNNNVANNPLGLSVLNMTGGTLTSTASGGGGDTTITNSINLNGNGSMSIGALGSALTFNTGTITVNNAPTLNLNGTASGVTFTNAINLAGDLTISGTHATSYAFNGGINSDSGSRTLTIADSGAGAVTYGTTRLGGDLSIVMNRNQTIGTILSNAVGAKTLTLSGSGTFDAGNITETTGTMGVLINSNTGGSYTFDTTASTYSGGTTLASGRLIIGADSTVGSGAVTQGPLGKGLLTIAGGVITPNNTTTRTLHNSLAITGDFQFNVIGGNNGAITFNPTSVTTPATGSIALVGARTITSNLNTLTLTGPITGSGSPSLTVKGPGTVALVNAGSASSFGNLTIGDTLASGALGGRLTANSQSAMGAGSYTVNFGGVLNPTANFSPTNVITLNNGGVYNPTGASAGITAFGAGSVVNSGATLQNGSGQTLTLNAANVILPSSGVLFNNSSNAVTFTGALPVSGGTLAFGGTGSNTFTTTAVSNLAGDQTLVFNQTGGGAMAFNGLSLGGNLTVRGGGSTGIVATIAQGAGGNLGTVTESGTRSISVDLAPTGVVFVSRTATGWTGGTTVTGGILASDGVTSTQKMLGANGVVLNGGGVRNQNSNSNNSTWQDNFTIGAAGGTIETFAGNNTQDVTFTGAISGSGPLTLRYGGTSSGTSSLILSPGSVSAFNSTINVVTSNGRGRVQFNANSLAGIGAGDVTVGAGVAFGVDALATLTGNISKFTTTADTILVLDNLGSANIDLSGGGLNRNLRLGNRGAFNYTGTITPNASAYNFTPGGTNNALTLTVANQLTGARSLDVRAGALAGGAYDVATGVLGISAANDYSGATTVSGVVRNGLMSGGQTGTTLQLNTGGNLSGSTAFVVEKGATLGVGGTNGQISAADPTFAIRGGGTLRIGSTTASENNGSTNRINDGATITLGDTAGGRGNLTMAFGSSGAVSESVKKLNLAFGDNNISTANTAAGTLALTFTDAAASVYNRSAGATVNIANAAGFSLNFTNTPTSNVSGTGGAAILVGAFINNAGFASAAGTVGAPTYTVQNASGSWAAGQNIDTSGAVTGTTTATSINSLRALNGGTFAIGAGGLVLDSGMMMVGSNGLTVNGPGTLSSGNGQDLIIHQAGSDVTINAQITGGTPLTLTNSSGTGNLHLTNSNNTFAGMNVFGNRVRVNNAGAWGSAGAINIAGGVVLYGANTDKVLSSGYSINVGTVGGTFVNNGTGVLTVQGAVTANGTLNVVGASGQTFGDGTLDLQGQISGAGPVALGAGNRNRVLFSNANNSNWTGGLLTLNNGSGSGTSNIFAYNANSFGSGAMALYRGANLYFDTNAAGATTLAQNIAFNANSTLSFWGLGSGLSTSGGTAPLTLSGQVIGSGGLTFQGRATADDQVSEIVLSSVVSTSGTPVTHSFGTATSAQNFVNSQGGIQLGVTGFRGTTATTTTDRVEDGTGAASAVLNGALGFVRFNGAPSFVPGAAGPGYISAIRKAGGGQDGRFGYLLTGSSLGTTYALPEGKSFVIGSLGTGTQQFGTLGSAGSGSNTAVLTGSAKLAGFAAGDVNIHANAVGDNQSLNLLARGAGDTLQIGTLANGVVFSPTYGDSGFANSVTLMATRTGTTAINKIGEGTVEIVNARFNNIGGAADSAKAGITLNVNAGTLKYTQVDIASAYAGVNVNSGGTLSGNGSVNGAVAVAGGGVLAPGAGLGILTTGSLTMTSGANFNVELTGSGSIAGVNFDQALVLGGINLGNATLNLLPTALTLTDGQLFTIINNDGTGDAVTGTFNGLSEGALAGNFSGMDLFITYTAESNALGSGNDVALYTVVPEPASLSLAGLAGAGLLARRRRRRA